MKYSLYPGCAGEATAKEAWLATRKVMNYLGLDLSQTFVVDALRKGLKVRLFDMDSDVLPQAEYIILQASLYQFIPRQGKILEKLFSSATKGIIISEPIRNLTNSRSRIVSLIARIGAKLLTGSSTERFNEKSLKELFNMYGEHVKVQSKICGEREMLGVFEK